MVMKIPSLGALTPFYGAGVAGETSYAYQAQEPTVYALWEQCFAFITADISHGATWDLGFLDTFDSPTNKKWFRRVGPLVDWCTRNKLTPRLLLGAGRTGGAGIIGAVEQGWTLPNIATRMQDAIDWFNTYCDLKGLVEREVQLWGEVIGEWTDAISGVAPLTAGQTVFGSLNYGSARIFSPGQLIMAGNGWETAIANLASATQSWLTKPHFWLADVYSDNRGSSGWPITKFQVLLDSFESVFAANHGPWTGKLLGLGEWGLDPDYADSTDETYIGRTLKEYAVEIGKRNYRSQTQYQVCDPSPVVTGQNFGYMNAAGVANTLRQNGYLSQGDFTQKGHRHKGRLGW